MTKIILYILSYLLGSIPSGIVISKTLKQIDPRTKGSKNIGATNMARINGLRAGIYTFLLDGLKGIFPVLIAKHYIGIKTAMACAIMSVLGHVFPIWLNFRGGKGVATAIFVILFINYKIAFLIITIWSLTFTLSGYSSLASLVSIFAAIIASMLFVNYTFLMLLVIGIIIGYKHIDNIKNLIYNKERRFDLMKN